MLLKARHMLEVCSKSSRVADVMVHIRRSQINFPNQKVINMKTTFVTQTNSMNDCWMDSDYNM